MVSTSNPKRMAEVFKKVAFIVYMTPYLNETAELADIVLPDARYLERLIPFCNLPGEFIAAGPGDWYWNWQQPVLEPPANVRPHIDVFLELADRAGFREDYYVMLNSMLNLQEPYRLDTSKRYTWEEIADIWGKAWFGPEHGLAWFKEHGFLVSGRKKVEEAYPRPFLKPRIPVYLEHFQTAGEEVRKVTQGLGIPWDVSDYQPLPDWKPCPAYDENSDEYDLYAVNYKLPFHSFSVTAQNPLLNELAEHHPYAYKVLIPAKVAAERGIRDGDGVWVESPAGRLEGRAKVTECIHPQVVGLAGTFGGWAEGRPIARGKGMHF
ncbi:MAG: molybdopterin dinucleotide binding domain-containing protein, partial [Dehalococcoidia bacterium]|nr:molybdopterin dinucleotide binding domain-containing protein [Dehalococcoidia bacterium]